MFTVTTIRDMVRLAVTRFSKAKLFFGHGSSNAYDEAINLIFQNLSLPLDTVEIFFDAKLSEEENTALQDLISRRINERIPAAYLTQEARLGNYTFYVDKRVIVPRSFIAEILHDGLAPWVREPLAITRTLDLCTGSGCLAILLAGAFPNATVDAVDVSVEALQVARINIEEYGLTERIDLIQSDMWQNIPPRQYDVIIANPPYVRQDSMAALPQEYSHEPQQALVAGTDGLQYIHIILERAAQFLSPDGILVVELGHNRSSLELAYPHIEFTWLSTAGGDDFLFLLPKKLMSGLSNTQ